MLQMPFMVDYKDNVWDEPAGREVLGWGPFNRLYRVEDGWIYVADHRPDVLTRMAGLSPFIDIERVATGEVEVILERHLGKLSTVEAVAMLESVRVTAHRYCDIAEVVMSDNALTRGLSVVIDHAELGKGFGIALPTLGGGKSQFLPARRPGMDTVDVLDEFGLRSQIPTLLRSKVVAVGEAPLVENSEAPHYWEMPEKVPSYMAPATLAKAVERISALIPQS
jgi:crotonobetainyl-CoA:carnitine CoA-transferase CaiB-like acyl-CoA transferase